MPDPRRPLVLARADQLLQPSTRRAFLRTLGAGGTLVLLPSMFAACDDDDDDVTGTASDATVDAVTLNLSTEVGVVQLIHVQEQTEAAFYNAAVSSSAFAGMSAEQREVVGDIRAVENIHREFVRALLGSNRLGRMRFNDATLATLTSTGANILRTSEMLEDTGVAALNGGGKFLSADTLAIVGKLASVEGRHVAAVRDLREALGVTNGLAAGTRFAGDDIVVPTGAYAGLDTKIEAAAAVARLASTGLPATTVTIGTPPPSRAGTPDFAPPTPTP